MVWICFSFFLFNFFIQFCYKKWWKKNWGKCARCFFDCFIWEIIRNKWIYINLEKEIFFCKESSVICALVFLYCVFCTDFKLDLSGFIFLLKCFRLICYSIYCNQSGIDFPFSLIETILEKKSNRVYFLLNKCN